MEERIKALEGITYREWQRVKSVIDERFSEIKDENIFNATEDTFEHLKRISNLESYLTAPKQ